MGQDVVPDEAVFFVINQESGGPDIFVFILVLYARFKQLTPGAGNYDRYSLGD